MNPFIVLYENTLTKEFCDHCISKFESDTRILAGRVGAGIKLDTKRSMDLPLSSYEEWHEEDQIFHNSLDKYLPHYTDDCDNNLRKMNIDMSRPTPFGGSVKEFDTGYQIQKTIPGDFYNWHDDASSDKIEKTGEVHFRVITFIWYLNDIAEGGWTEFVDGTKIQPRAGNLLMFPALWNVPHRGVTPKSETKYICTGWIYGVL